MVMMTMMMTKGESMGSWALVAGQVGVGVALDSMKMWLWPCLATTISGLHMVMLSNRLKMILNNIKLTADPTIWLVALQELSELQSISTEDTLSGYFQVDVFIKELVKIMGGKGGQVAQDEDC